MSGREAHRRLTTLLSALLVVLGVLMIARTIAAGGSATAIGVLLGVLFVAAGLGRIWVARRTR